MCMIGSIGMIYSVLWIGTIYDSPQEHPKITKEEIVHLKETIPGMAEKEQIEKVNGPLT